MDLLNFFTSLATVSSKSLREVQNVKTPTVLYFDMNTLMYNIHRQIKKEDLNNIEYWQIEQWNQLAMKMSVMLLNNMQLYVLASAHLPIVRIYAVFDGFFARMLHNKKIAKITANNMIVQSGTILCNLIEYHMKELLLTVQHNIVIDSYHHKGEISLKIIRLIQKNKLPCNHIIITKQRSELLCLVLYNKLRNIYFSYASHNVITQTKVKLLHFSVPAFITEINNELLIKNMAIFDLLLQHKHFPHVRNADKMLRHYYSIIQQSNNYYLISKDYIVDYDHLSNILLLYSNKKDKAEGNVSGCYCYLRELEWYLSYWSGKTVSYVLTYNYTMPTTNQLINYLKRKEYYEVSIQLSNLTIGNIVNVKYNFPGEYNCILYDTKLYQNYFTKEQCALSFEVKRINNTDDFNKIYRILNYHKYKIQTARASCLINNKIRIGLIK